MNCRRGAWQLLLIAVVLLATVPGGVGGSVAPSNVSATSGPTPGAATAETAYLDHHVTLSESDDNVTVEVTLREVPGLESFSFDLLPEASVTSADGFENRRGRWYWDGSGSNPSLVYELPVDEPGDVRLRGEDWAVVAHLGTAISWTESRDVDVERRFTGEGGYGGDEAVAVGNVTVRTFADGGEEATVVVPTVVAESVAVAEVANLTTDVARWMPAGERRARTSVFVVPDGSDFGAPGVAVGGGDFLVEAQHAGADGSVNAGLLAHEYAHTRQAFASGEEMAWLTEGSASYYEDRYLYERRGRSFPAYRRYVSVAGEPYADATLAEVHPTSTAAYRKGSHVLTALDVLVRQRSDGEARVDDLLDRMNAHEGRVTYDDFRSMVRAEAGTGLDGWLDLYVRGGGVPKLPENASLVAPTGWDSSEAPGNFHLCVGSEWRTRPALLPAGEPVQVFDATHAVTRFSNATRVDGWTGACDPDDLPVTFSKDGEGVPHRYVFEDDTTLTFRSAFDPKDVTTLDVAVVDQSTPAPTGTPTPTASPTSSHSSTPADGSNTNETRMATPTTADAAGTERATETAPTATAADPEVPPLVVEPQRSGVLVQRGSVSALFTLPILVGIVGFLASIAGGTYLLLRE